MPHGHASWRRARDRAAVLAGLRTGVLACARIGASRLGGQVIWVVGPGLQRHYYAHLSRFAEIEVGQRIGAGTVLGYVGNTGNARGSPPHLHYGIYTRAGAINPYPRLRHQRAQAT